MAFEAEFLEWWKAYPNRVGKIAAQAAYRKAKKLATAQELLDGIERYRHMKPDYADWCHPTTWLNHGRWMDEAAAPAKTPKGATNFTRVWDRYFDRGKP